MNNDFHREWNSRLKGIAHNWSKKYAWIAEDEAYSELLVWYAEACSNYDESKGKFGTYFYFFMHRAYKNLAEQWHNDNGMAEWDLDTILDVESRVAEKAIHQLLIDLDKVYLSKDAQALLHFILTTDLTADSKHNRVGANTVMVKAHEQLNWTYTRSKKALEALKVFYGERAIA